MLPPPTLNVGDLCGEDPLLLPIEDLDPTDPTDPTGHVGWLFHPVE